MTLAQAQACVAAASNAGFDAAMTHTAGVWHVRVTSAAIDIPVTSAASLATSQGVVGTVSLVEYV